MEQLKQEVDIKETELYREYPDAFKILLRDHSRFFRFKSEHPEMSKQEIDAHVDDPCNLIIWATDDYESQGEGYGFNDPISVEKIIGEHGMLIRPRCEKSAAEQYHRVKDKAEVFTPSWVCNVQNNQIDEMWFGRKDVFNREIVDDEGKHTWITNVETITDFPEGKTWMDYVRDTRMEITCGEGPYLASRYDTTTGEYIPVKERIGLLDRKLRIISENCDEPKKWREWVWKAYHNTYGYEWQGDNLLLARESLLYTFLEYYIEKFHKFPHPKSVMSIAYIISWNIWQMDGLKMVVPASCDNETEEVMFLGKQKKECLACTKGELYGHIGIPCYIKNWNASKGNQYVMFSTLIH